MKITDDSPPVLSALDRPNSYIGRSVPRPNLQRLTQGRGQYVSDVTLPRMAHVAFVRSPHAHARIVGIKADAAKKSPGVIAVFTGKDLLADGLHLMDHKPSLEGPPDVKVDIRPGFNTFIHAQPMLPADKARHVGEPVAVVIAETTNQAKDGAELVEFEPQK